MVLSLLLQPPTQLQYACLRYSNMYRSFSTYTSYVSLMRVVLFVPDNVINQYEDKDDIMWMSFLFPSKLVHTM